MRQALMDNHPWNSANTARNDGRLCKLLIQQGDNLLELDDAHYLSRDGFWYRLRPPKKLDRQPLFWKPI
jgi:hypothetical protein